MIRYTIGIDELIANKNNPSILFKNKVKYVNIGKNTKTVTQENISIGNLRLSTLMFNKYVDAIIESNNATMNKTRKDIVLLFLIL